MASASIDPKFVALTEDAQFKIWRIENFELVPWEDLGAFFTGDSYVILSAVVVGTSKRVKRDVYFWIGAESTQDEYGTAALKTVQLSDRFNGEPTHHREVQHHESDSFHKLFADHGGVRYLTGGVDSGFKSVSTQKGVSLYQIKGKRNPLLFQVPPTGKSLNHGDVFIITSDSELFLWFGKDANPSEKIKAAQFFDVLSAKFRGRKVTRLEKSATTPEFWAQLGGETPIAAGDAASDLTAEKENVKKIYDADGFKLIAEGVAATKDKLPPGKVSIIERGELIIVYLGKGTSDAVRKGAIQKGLEFLTAKGLPNYYSVQTALEGVENDGIDLVFA
jgi:hypothetical protein